MEQSAHGNLCTAATFASLALSPLLSLSLSSHSLFSSQASNALSLPRWQRRVSPQIVIPKRLGLQARSQDVRRVRSVHLPLCLVNKQGRSSCAIILRARPHGPLHLTFGEMLKQHETTNQKHISRPWRAATLLARKRTPDSTQHFRTTLCTSSDVVQLAYDTSPTWI